MVSSFILDKMSPCRQEQNRQNQGIMSKPVESFSNSANTTSVIHEGIHENFALVLNAFASWCSLRMIDIQNVMKSTFQVELN